MKIKKVQSVCLILACIAATGLIGCGKTDETPKKHEAITFMAPYLEVDSFIEEVHKTYPEIELEVVPYSGANTTTCLQNMLEADDLPDRKYTERYHRTRKYHDNTNSCIVQV